MPDEAICRAALHLPNAGSLRNYEEVSPEPECTRGNDLISFRLVVFHVSRERTLFPFDDVPGVTTV